MFEDRRRQLDRTIFVMDIVVLASSLMLALVLHQLIGIDEEVDFFSHWAIFPLCLSLQLYFLSYFGGYKSPRNIGFWTYTWAISGSTVISISLIFAMLFALSIEYVNRSVVGFYAIISFVLLLSLRGLSIVYFKRAIARGDNLHKVLIIGTGQRAQLLAETLHHRAEWGVDIIGYLDPEPDRKGMRIAGAKVLGGVHDISRILKDNLVDDVIVAIPRRMIGDAEDIVYACEEEGIKLRFMADLFDLQVTRVSLSEVGAIPLLTLEPVALNENWVMIKRAVDIAMVVSSLPLVLPLMGLIALAVKIDSSGPIFFVQPRVGFKKRIFPMLKFRSMCKDADQMMAEIEHLNEAEGPIFKIAKDPRITRVGRILRKTSMDELPQLFNVLRGEMSIVGPRPMSLRDVDLFDRGIQRKRFSVKPGLTCLWQISGRSNLPFSKWIELDLQYIENWSPLLDTKILFKTIPVVLFGKGAV